MDGVVFNGLMNKGLLLKSGQIYMQVYMFVLLWIIELGNIDLFFIIIYCYGFNDVVNVYVDFNVKQDGCIKVVMIF